jgi:hypothetical protein
LELKESLSSECTDKFNETVSVEPAVAENDKLLKEISNISTFCALEERKKKDMKISFQIYLNFKILNSKFFQIKVLIPQFLKGFYFLFLKSTKT